MRMCNTLRFATIHVLPPTLRATPLRERGVLFALCVFLCALCVEISAAPVADEPSAPRQRPVVAIPDYLQTNGVVSARRPMTETLLAAGVVPIVLPEMDDASADRVLSLKVNSSHTYRCETVAPGFRVTAVSEDDGVVEAMEHETLPIYGFQFHPEYYWEENPMFLELIKAALGTK